MPITFGPAQPTIEEADEDEEPTRQGQEIAARAGCMTGAMQDLLAQLFNEQFEKQFKKQFKKQSKQFQKKALRIVTHAAEQPWQVSPARHESDRLPLIVGAQPKTDTATTDTADATMNSRLRFVANDRLSTDTLAVQKAVLADTEPYASLTVRTLRKTFKNIRLIRRAASEYEMSTGQLLLSACQVLTTKGLLTFEATAAGSTSQPLNFTFYKVPVAEHSEMAKACRAYLAVSVTAFPA